MLRYRFIKIGRFLAGARVVNRVFASVPIFQQAILKTAVLEVQKHRHVAIAHQQRCDLIDAIAWVRDQKTDGVAVPLPES